MKRISEQSENGFEFLDHPADVWVHAWGKKIENAFQQCVYGLMATMFDNWAESVENTVQKTLSVEGDDFGSILVEFISEFLYLFDVDDFICKTVTITSLGAIDSGKMQLIASLEGDTFKPGVHIPDVEVKAITYSFLEIDQEEDRSDIKIVYDI